MMKWVDRARVETKERHDRDRDRDRDRDQDQEHDQEHDQDQDQEQEQEQEQHQDVDGKEEGYVEIDDPDHALPFPHGSVTPVLDTCMYRKRLERKRYRNRAHLVGGCGQMSDIYHTLKYSAQGLGFFDNTCPTEFYDLVFRSCDLVSTLSTRKSGHHHPTTSGRTQPPPPPPPLSRVNI